MQEIQKILKKLICIKPEQKEKIQTQFPSLSEEKKADLFKILSQALTMQEEILTLYIFEGGDIQKTIQTKTREKIQKIQKEKETKNAQKEEKILHSLEEEIDTIFES